MMNIILGYLIIGSLVGLYIGWLFEKVKRTSDQDNFTAWLRGNYSGELPDALFDFIYGKGSWLINLEVSIGVILIWPIVIYGVIKGVFDNK